jgi:hypothetical protein
VTWTLCWRCGKHFESTLLIDMYQEQQGYVCSDCFSGRTHRDHLTAAARESDDAAKARTAALRAAMMDDQLSFSDEG